MRMLAFTYFHNIVLQELKFREPMTRDIVAEAQAAAAVGDEEEGLQGAAARAAARAASLGLAAASSGYSYLGGVDEHVSPHAPALGMPGMSGMCGRFVWPMPCIRPASFVQLTQEHQSKPYCHLLSQAVHAFFFLKHIA